MLRRTIARLSEAAFMSEPSTGATGARDKPWIFRTYAGHSTAHDSNALYRKNLAKGQTGLSVAFDLPTQHSTQASSRRIVHSIGRGRTRSSWDSRMNDKPSSSTPTGINGAVKIERDRTYFLTMGTLAAVFAIGIIAWALLGNSPSSWLWAILSIVTLIVWGFRARTFLDRTPVVVLDRSGICDRRLRFPVIPWSQIRSVRPEAKIVWKTPHIGVAVELRESVDESDPDLPQEIYIDLAGLDIQPITFVEHVQRFAPLQIDMAALE
jgi:hypothetical protein